MKTEARLLASGALEISVSGVDLDDMFARARVLSARENVARLGRDVGYRIEDAAAMTVRGLRAEDVAATERWLRRRLPPFAEVTCTASSGPLTLIARLEDRMPETARRYTIGEDGRVAVESVELHVVEHCNLRCAQCCNVSPYLPTKQISVAEVRRTCERLAATMRPHVVKIMGGEPLLHPEIGAIVRAIRESRVATRVRLFTNGLLLKSLDDDAFSALDELTVSSYASAPVKADVLADTVARARRFDVVLNVKHVASFSTVLVDRPRSEGETQATYDACWLRHRCLVIRDGTFYKCTRAAYHREFHEKVVREGADPEARRTQAELGIALDDERFVERVVEYLDDPMPIASCTHCLGSSGPLAPHVQLRKRNAAEGLLT